MADIKPFKGILYNPRLIADMTDVVSPPYDVIPDHQQQAYYDRHPNNIIRLILEKIHPSDTKSENRYTRAADNFNRWMSDKILCKDPVPALYLTALDFSVQGKSSTRFGLIALAKIESFDSGVVLPHERTFSQVKSERLELIKTCHANFSQIFALYSDHNSILDTLISSIDFDHPDMDLTDNQNHRHRLWRITDPTIHHFISEAFRDKSLFIADGHHRYETALNYRNLTAENCPNFTADHPANYVMMYLTGMEDPGLVILPAHRMIRNISDSALISFIQKASDYFDIDTIPMRDTAPRKARRKMMADLSAGRSQHAIGVCIKNDPNGYLMTLKPDVMQQLFADDIPPSMMALDVTVLTRLVLMQLLGFDQSDLDNETLFSYSSDEEDAFEAALTGGCDICFILNPTPISQVRRIAEERLTMPRKSTYFYPKVLTGLVLNHLVPDTGK